jgi:hypothetical protein
MERLLGEDSAESNKEHVIESASRHVTNILEKFDPQYDSMVAELTSAWGAPQFNHRPEDTNENSRIMFPSWSSGTGPHRGKTQALRLCYWKNEKSTRYVMVRGESDDLDKEKLIYFALVLGVRKKRVVRLNIDKSKHNPKTLTTFTSWFTKLFR